MSDNEQYDPYNRIDKLASAKERELERLVDEILAKIQIKTRRAWKKKEFLQLVERDGFVCGICGKPLRSENIQVDHKVPICKGGGNEIENLQLTHGDCNLEKGPHVDIRDLLEYLRTGLIH
jgi:5-methylcytosine-specific restriction endonuclease McrA